MNVLLFVMSMLMIFALMTYAKLDTYRGNAAVEGEFIRYMEMVERTYINMSADKLYEKVKFSKPPKAQAPKSDPNPETTPKPKTKGSGRISIKPLINSKMGEENNKAAKQSIDLLQQLMNTLYGQQPQFQSILQVRPTAFAEVIEALKTAIQKLPQSSKITQTIDLANLELGDDLDELFYMMLKGCPTATPPKMIQEVIVNSEVDLDEAEETQEYTSDKSYDSLLNFIDLHNSMNINIFLASKPLLQAIYDDEQLVDELITVRYHLYNAVQSKEMTADEASSQFKGQFQHGNDEDSILYYRITGTNPQGYN